VKPPVTSPSLRLSLPLFCLLAWLSLPVPLLLGQTGSDDIPEWRVLLHSHGDLAGGLGMVESLQRAAHSFDLDAVVVTEQLLAEWHYGLPVLRRIWNYRRRLPSVRTFGIEKYFETLAELDAVVPEVTLIAGTEVAPYYRWTGAPWKRDLSMWDWQRNILVLGLPAPEDYARLPVLGLRRSLIQSWHDVSWLAVLAIFGLFFVLALRGQKWGWAALFLVPLLGLAISGPPPPQPFPAYRDTTSITPYQALIDSVRTRGGFTRADSLCGPRSKQSTTTTTAGV
jgi:hypothetical protein